MRFISFGAMLALPLALVPVAGAGAQVPGAGAPGREEPRPPIPPGVPTNEHNVHLPTEGEVKLGREGAAEAERQFKVIDSGPYHERLQRVARQVARAFERPEIIGEYRRVYHLPREDDRSRRVPFEWSFKVLDTGKEVNAFSLAGGPVYFTRALLDFTPSDDELAAVLAHECAHVGFHHVEKLLRKQKKTAGLSWAMLAAILAGATGALSGSGASTVSGALIGAQLVSIATLTGYGRELETEADRIAVMALVTTPYHPTAMMTFMQKLAREDRLRGNPDYGIFQSHPYTNERVEAIRKDLVARGISVDAGLQRRLSGTFRLEVETQRIGGKEAAEVRLDGRPLFVAVASEGGLGPAERARSIARRLEELFLDNLTFNDVRQAPDRSAVLFRGIPVIRVHPEDAAVLGSAAAVAERAYNGVMRVLLKEKLDMS